MDAPTDVADSPGPQAPPPGPRRLRRRPDDGPIAGVCAGIAEYFDIDPVIVRIAAVVLAFSGASVIAYGLAWIFVPAAPGPGVHGASRAAVGRHDAAQVVGIILLISAISVFWGDWWRHWFLPLGLMGLGGWLLLRPTEDDTGADAPTAPPPRPSEVPEATTAVPTGADEGVDESLALVAEDGGSGHGPAVQPSGEAPFPVPPAVPPTPTPPARRRVLGPVVFGALLIWAGVAFLADVTVETGLAGGLLIIGMGCVLGAFVGGSRVLILPALLVGAALAVTAVVDIPLAGPIGQQRWAPASLAQLDDDYAVSLGEGTLDLRAVDIPTGERVELEASVGVGHLVVLVPDGPAVEVSTAVGAGESDVLGQRQSGYDVTTDRQVDGDATSGTIALDLQVGVGQVEVRRGLDLVSDSPVPTTTLG
jgi:phage shock protein PspC (stress-responsive transcriptional regulator)